MPSEAKERSQSNSITSGGDNEAKAVAGFGLYFSDLSYKMVLLPYNQAEVMARAILKHGSDR